MSSRVPPAIVWRADGIGVAALLCCAVVWYLIGVRPVMDARAEMTSAAAEIETRRGEIAKAGHTVTSLNDQVLAAEQTEAARAVRLGKASQINSRVDALAELALAAGLRLDSIRPGEPILAPKFTSVPIVISGGGSYPTAVEFLRALRVRFPDVGVRGFDLRAANGESGIGAFAFDLVWYTEPTIGPARASRPAQAGANGPAPSVGAAASASAGRQ